MVKTISDTKIYKLLKARNSVFINLVEEIHKYAYDLLPKINKVFSNYTGHGIMHSINVMEYMYDLCDDTEELSDLELAAIIYVALLHDIGMVVTDDEIASIKKEEINLQGRKYSQVLKKYSNEIIALQECIRPAHAIRSKNHIMNVIDEKLFLIPGYTNVSFVDDIANICQAHNENFEWITGHLSNDLIKGTYTINSQYIAILLRIADYLDIDEGRAPLYLYQFLNPKDYSKQEWLQHFVIENKEKIVLNSKTGLKNIEFYGESTNPNIHRKLLKYFDLINDELIRAVELSEKFQDKKYLLDVKPTVLNKIRTKGFNFSDFKLTLDYKAVTSLLMGENIYGNAKFGLRELIQNSIDACKVMQEESKSRIEFKFNPYLPFINIIIDKDRNQITLFDNGRGMSVDILKKYFLNVGVSYYVSDDYLLKGNRYNPIGNYGIGFLACFMLSDKVSVLTKYYEDNEVNKIEFERSSEYICLTFEDTPRPQGTEIILDYEQFFQIFDNKVVNIKNFIQKNFLNSDIPIKIVTVEDGNVQTEDIQLDSVSTQCENGVILDSYLNDIEARVEFSYKGINFTEYLSDINGNTCYQYDEDTNLLKIEDRLDHQGYLKNFIKDGVVKYISMPIISQDQKSNYEKVFDVLEDFDETLEKIDYETIDIISMDRDMYYGSYFIEREEQYVFGNYSYKDICKFNGHAKGLPIKVEVHEQKVIQGNGNKIVPYNTDIPFAGQYIFNHKDFIYVKYVSIPEAMINIPFLIDGIQLKSAAINVKNRNIIPNVSRNNISKQQNLDLAYAIGKAIHLWVLENVVFSEEEKALIRNFINTCYSDDNFCLR